MTCVLDCGLTERCRSDYAALLFEYLYFFFKYISNLKRKPIPTIIALLII